MLAVDNIESQYFQFDSRPYALANSLYQSLPIFGEFRGRDNPELIVTLDPQPEVKFKLVGTGRETPGTDPVRLREKPAFR